MRPRIHVYSLCWNEELFLPYFLRHYCSIAERIVIYDNMSDDRSVAVIQSFPHTVVRRLDTGGLLRDDVFTDLLNSIWKQSKGQADWVILVAIDEILWHPHLLDYLEANTKRGVTIPVPSGYEMVSDTFPTTPGQVYDEVKYGAFSLGYSKQCIFDPNAIEDMTYDIALHHARPTGRVNLDYLSELALLHYPFLGTDYVLSRFLAKEKRLYAEARERGWGCHYSWTREAVIEYIESRKRDAVQIVP